MKSFTHPVRRALVALAASSLAQFAQADCSASANTGACPIKVNGAVVFDRCFGSFNGQPTDVGNAVCNGLRDTHKLLDQVGDDNRRALQRADADWKALLKVTLDGAIDKDAVRDMQSALAAGKEIETEINGLLKDPQCGSKASMDALQRRMTETGQLIVGGAQVAGLTLEAIGKLRPVLDEAGKAITELQRLLDAANKKGSKAKAEYDALSRALADLQKEVAALLATDFNSVVAAGTGLATGVVPFVAECSGCAASLGTAIASLGTGTGTTAGGAAACPETAGVSCALAAVGLPTGAVGAGVMAAISSGPCAAAAAGMDQMSAHVKAIEKFVDGLVKLANAIPKSATQALTAGQALGRLATEMGTEGQQSLRAIQASLNAMQPAFDAAGEVLENRIAPKVQRMAGNFVQTLGRDTELLAKCYAKLNRAVAHMGQDLGEAAALLAQASTEIVDAGKVVGNLSAQGQDGLRAASKFAGDEWKDIDQDFRALNRRLWGVNPGVVDLARTGPHVVALAANPGEVRDIAHDSTKLLERAVELPGKAVNAGKRAFLDQDRLTTQAKATYNAGQAKAKRVAIDIAKLKLAARAQIDRAPKMAVIAPTTTAIAAWPTAARPRLLALSVVK